jgi:hypothetical protein
MDRESIISYVDTDDKITLNNKSDRIKELCKDHYLDLSVVCISCMVSICYKCALFGEHKGHEYKDRSEYLEEIKDLQEKEIDQH